MNLCLRCCLLLPLVAAVSCSNERQPVYDLRGHTMGTTYDVTLIAPPVDTDLEQLRAEINEKLEHIEDIASTYRTESELSVFNDNESTDWIDVSVEFCEIISAALDMSMATDGAFDITVGSLVNLWGFGPPNKENELPSEDELAAARSIVGYEMLQTDCGNALLRKASANIYVDLSGWAKGYAVDEIAALLDTSDLVNYIVEIGGELRVRGRNARNEEFAIAIETPLHSRALPQTIVRLTDAAVATSGDYRNFFEIEGTQYSHMIDPWSGRPTSHNLASVTVVHESAAYADAMATALLVLGPKKGLQLANELDIAAYFSVSTPPGFEFRASDAFSAARYFSNHARM